MMNYDSRTEKMCYKKFDNSHSESAVADDHEFIVKLTNWKSLLNHKPKQRNKNQGLLFVAFMTVLVLGVILISGMQYWQLKNQLDSINIELHRLDITLQKETKLVEEKQKLEKPNQKPLDIIHLCGSRDNNTTAAKEGAGETFTDWKIVNRNGNIQYNKETGIIIIKEPGVYFVSAQVSLSIKDNEVVPDATQFHIKRNSKSEMTSVIPKEACEKTCSHHVSIMAQLAVNDEISVSSDSTGYNFVIACEKAFFSVKLLSSDQS